MISPMGNSDDGWDRLQQPSIQVKQVKLMGGSGLLPKLGFTRQKGRSLDEGAVSFHRNQTNTEFHKEASQQQINMEVVV